MALYDYDCNCMEGGRLLCGRCLDLEEPPWWPNNRQQCAESLEFALPSEVKKKIADLLAANVK